MPAQALYLKWRPQTFEDVIGQDHITRTLRNALRQGRLRHAYLFSGPRGTGKTSTARLLAKAVNCKQEDPDNRPCNECSYCQAVNEGRFLDLIEIDAASHTGVDDVRDLRDKIAFAPNEGQFKVYIIDEVHRFSGAAFDALLKTLEEPPPHAIFVLATTEIAKVPATIKSRCQMFEFRRVALEEVADQLARISQGEGVSIDRSALELIAREGTGSVRDSISLLDQLIADPEEYISLEMAEQILGTASGENIVELADALIHNDSARGLDIINAAVDSGADPRQFGRQVIDHLRAMMLVQMGGGKLVDASAERRAVIDQQAGAIGRKALVAAVRAFNNAVMDWKGGWQPQLPLELAFLESIKPVEEDEPVATARVRPPVRTQDDLPEPVAPDPKQGPKSASPAADDPAGALGVSEIRSRWIDLQRATRHHDPTLPALLEHALPRDVKRGKLIVAVRNDVFKQKLEDESKRDAFQRAFNEIFGTTLELVFTVVADLDSQKNAQEELIAQDDVLSYGINELGGQITDLDE